MVKRKDLGLTPGIKYKLEVLNRINSNSIKVRINGVEDTITAFKGLRPDVNTYSVYTPKGGTIDTLYSKEIERSIRKEAIAEERSKLTLEDTVVEKSVQKCTPVKKVNVVVTLLDKSTDEYIDAEITLKEGRVEIVTPTQECLYEANQFISVKRII